MLEAVAALPEVAEIEADRVYTIPDPVKTTDERTLATEWGLNAIRAPEVWSTFGVRGEDIVVGSIDSGVRYTHGAVALQYRGRNSDGTFDHNYNWHDPSNVCGTPSLAPCDNNDHGTHTMGTMVGDDGGANQVGVAPRTKWMTAKGCETNSCSRPALLSSAQFILAPTDLNNQNPDPTKRPHIVNNSWGGNDGADTWYQASVQAWVASGIFPSFSNGNAGPACGTVGAPASYPESFGVGGFAENGTIYGNSSRGPSPVGGAGIKPQVTAPGVAVRSSTADSDTSYAAVHRHLDGRTARFRDRRADVVGGARARSATSTRRAHSSPRRPSTRPTSPAAAPPRTTTSGARASSTPSPPSTCRREGRRGRSPGRSRTTRRSSRSRARPSSPPARRTARPPPTRPASTRCCSGPARTA